MGTTLDDHVDYFDLECPVSNAEDKQTTKLYLFALVELDFQQLVDSFLIVEGIHDGQINRPAQINQVRFGMVFNSLLGNG